jgi:hypothetical protein
MHDSHHNYSTCSQYFLHTYQQELLLRLLESIALAVATRAQCMQTQVSSGCAISAATIIWLPADCVEQLWQASAL